MEARPPPTSCSVVVTIPYSRRTTLVMDRMGKGTGGRFLIVGSLIAVVTATLMLPGCRITQPDFTDRSRQDCERGDQEACQMLEALNPAKTTPVRPKPPPRPTQVQMDVQAIQKGIERARASPKAGYQEDLPWPDTPRYDVPVPPQVSPDTGLPDERGLR
jgi:hypothetical protein